MPASPQHLPRHGRPVAAAALFCLLAAWSTAPAQDVTPEAAVAGARALERDGLFDEAETYLSELVAGDESLARNASVLWELARLTADGETAHELAGEVAARSRSGELVAAAHAVRGDYLYATGHYAAAAGEYEAAGERARGEAAVEAGLKRAAALLASGDASAAEEAARSVLSTRDLGADQEALARTALGRALLVRGETVSALAEFMLSAEAGDASLRLAALAGASEAAIAAGDDSTAVELLGTIVEDPEPSYERAWAQHLLESVAARLARPEPAPGQAPADGE